MNPQNLYLAESAAPAAPTAPTAPTAPAAPAAPCDVRVFGNGMAALKEQDDTQYKTLDRMNVACSHCGALHWKEVLIPMFFFIMFCMLLRSLI